MNRRHVIAAALAASLVAGQTTAAAQQAGAASGQRPAARPRRVRDALSGEALGAFERGSTLFEDADFRGARAEFEHAYDLAGEPRILYNVAVCDKMLHKYTRAVESLERSLREGGKQLPAEYVNRTKETIATLAPYVSKIVITADQQGASVLIDGEPVGSTPIDGPIAIEVGEHLVSVRKSGYLDVPKRVRVTGSEIASASFELEAAVSRAELTVGVSGAPPEARVLILIDGVEVGDAPFRTMLEFGPHTIGARAAGLTAPPQRIELKAREPVTVTLPLERESKLGRLRVRTDEESDVIELDGRDVGRGSVEQQVQAGEHHLRVKRAGVDPRWLDFVIGENETRTVNLSLEKKGGLPTWFWVGGGALLAGGATVAIVLLTRRTEYEGSTPGTLPPRVLPAGFTFGGP